jgi:signal transduction histidine kinase/predicted RNA-binding protein with RPS1 domain/DNA-binding NarL/FixJ family response regulator
MSTLNKTSTPPLTSVTVQRLLPFGLLVVLTDGQVGLIREREIAWERQARRRWHNHFRVGDVLEAVVIGPGHDNRLELSLRLAEADPWATIQQRYKLGQLVEGTVMGVQSYGVFVEIEAGITGLLHASRLPGWVQQHNPVHLFWIGDHVKVVVERIDPQYRRIGLSLTRALSERWVGMELVAEHYVPADAQESAHSAPVDALATQGDTFAATIPPMTLLVVEDDPIQLNAIKKWLQNDHTIYAAETAEDGLAYLDEVQPDAVLMDYGLPAIDGIEALRRIQSRYPNIKRILMTDWARANEHIHELDALRANNTQLMIKPLTPADVEFALMEALAPRESSLDDAGTGATKDDDESGGERAQFVNLVETYIRNQHTRQTALHNILDTLRRMIQASKIVLFRLDPSQRKIDVLAESGSAPLNREALVDLIYSPVRDVAEDRHPFRVENAEHVEPRVRYLKPLLSFRSCLGLPVPARVAASFALFVFEPCEISPVHEHHASAAALALGTLIEQEEFREHARTMQRLALLGQLSRALVHEINHQLSPVNFTLVDLEQQCCALQDQSHTTREHLDAQLTTLHQTIRELQESVQHLTETARLFGQVALQHKEARTDLLALLNQTREMVQDRADRAHVQIDVFSASNLGSVQVQSAHFQQMLLNLLINAIQQIELFRSSGRVVVRLLQRAGPHTPVIQVHIEDDAGGIHREHWERVFELGFTTRHESGSGMGLHITRSLAEAMGGRVFIKESWLLWGTTFVLELPLAT